jgi:hypothetical protein
VGLEYFPDPTAFDSGATSPTIVWTENMASLLKMSAMTSSSNPNSGPEGQHVAPFYWRNAIPPLRAYHTWMDSTGTETVVHDRISNSFSSTSGSTGKAATVDSQEDGNCAANPASYDCYEQSALKADGIAGFLSFAPGKYQVSAYGIRGDLTNNGGVHKATSQTSFANAKQTIELADNKQYTIVAIGRWNVTNGVDPATSPIFLDIFEEQTNPVAFGKAEIRFYHGLNTQTNSDGSVKALKFGSRLDSTATTEIVSNLVYRSVSSYVVIEPGLRTFPITSGATTDQVATGASVTAKIPAGTRATSFCGSHHINGQPFCRMIPTRIVAYVRLVLDTANLDLLVPGRFGPQKLGETSLSVWQSYDYALPEFSAEHYSVTPRNMEQVIPATAPGSVSGYGEVNVPMFIMDSATAPRIGWSCFDGRSSTVADASLSLGCSNTVNSVATADATTQFGFQSGSVHGATAAVPKTSRLSTSKFSARFKRVNLYVKTDGMATLALRQISDSNVPGTQLGTGFGSSTDSSTDNYKFDSTKVNPGSSTSIQSNPHFGFIDVDGVANAGAFVDRSVEPGEYYSMYVKACDREFMAPGTTIPMPCPFLNFKDNVNPTGHIPTQASPAPGALLAGWSRDQAVSDTFEVKSAGTSMIQVTPIDDQNFQGTLTFSTPGSNGGAKVITLGASTKVYTDGKGLVGGTVTLAGYTDSGRNTVPGQNEHLDVILPPPNAWVDVSAGTYTYEYVSANAANTFSPAAQKCSVSWPDSSGTVTFEAGKRYTIYVLNEYSCSIQNAATTKLKLVIAETRAAVGSSTSSTRSLRSESSVESSTFHKVDVRGSSAASTVSASLAVLLAALLAVFALV